MVASEAEGRAEASRRIAACRAARADELDLGGLQLTVLDDEILRPLCELTWLRRLFLGPGAEAREIPRVASLIFGRKNLKVNSLGALPGALFNALTGLEQLELALNNLQGLPHSIASLSALTSLNLRDNRIGTKGAQALKRLTALTSLNLRDNRIRTKGAQALKGLTALTSLNLAANHIGADGAQALKGLAALTSLDLSSNRIGDEGAQALKGLTTLTSLGLSNNGIGDEGAQALKGLTVLTSLDLSFDHIGAEGARALKGLTALTSLDLSFDHIGAEGAQALKDLTALTSLKLMHNRIGDEGAQALKGLTALTSLNLADNGIGDLSPLASLRNLRDINLSGCHLDHDVPAFWMLPSLEKAILHDASLPGVPIEVLSEHSNNNCLDRLRAHFADFTGDDVAVGDVKLMILGNGRVGKTQICRRLRGESFDETVPSTHGIQVSSLPLAPRGRDTPVTLKIWDFGGQDIYHGTHALFLKSRAVFLLVWTPQSEAEQFHTHGGFTFRNQPLAYWLAYVRTFGGARSPVLVIQTQCDRPEDEREAPLPPGALDGFGYKKFLHYSAKGDGTHARGHAALEETLLDAVQWMRDNQSVARIGPGRAAVKEALEAKLEAGQRLISHQGFLNLCGEIERTGKGRVSKPELLLDYLHHAGTVFYRQGLFGDQIILDQAWALEAVYAVFDRASRSFKKIARNHGRFRRSELAEWVWQQHGAPEQELFLSFMQQCGICFTIDRENRDKRVEAEYIAPDLLPARSDDETQKRLKLVWDDASPDAEAVLTFALLPPGLMRALIARIGGDAGLAAEYWRDGVCFYDAQTASRALIEQRWTEGWAGEVHIATQRGQAGVLLQRLIGLVENDHISLGARASGKKVTGIEPKAEARDDPNAKADETPVRPGHEPSTRFEYFVSYALGDDTAEGMAREAVVDRLCAEAVGRGKTIIRDKTEIRIGDRISTFMDRIGKGAVNGRVCIVLSDRYLRSAYCMHELFDVWRNCREDGATFIDRTRIFVSPCARIATAVERAQYVIYWQGRFKEVDDLIRQHGQFVLSDKDNAEFRLMSRFASETANVLQLVQDILRPRLFDEYVEHVFD